jgi:hypothetical protein
MAIYITGDTHGGFQRFGSKYFPQQKEMSREDCVIITGDYIEKNIIPKSFILR